MKRLVVTSLLACSVLAAELASQQLPVFKGATETVPVYVTVTDDNRLVPNLTRDDFLVLDNGRQQQLAVFDNSPQPVRLIVMLDSSGSMYGNLGLLRAASRQLFARLSPEDRARIGTFGNEIEISPTFTNDAAALIAALPREIPESAPTPLWAAVNKALDAFEDEGGRRVVLVLSDGKDSGPIKWGEPFVTVVDVIDRAQREEVMIYSVGMRSRSAPGRQRFGNIGQQMAADLPDPGLGTMALETGGGYFEIRPSDDLAAAFERVVDELHSQYLLGFAPPDRDGKRHKIEVKLRPKGLKARARKNYVAPRKP